MGSAQAGGDSTAAPPQSPGRAERWVTRRAALQPRWMGPDEAETFTFFFSLVNLPASVMINMKFFSPFAMCFC